MFANIPILSLLIAAPLLGLAVVLALPRQRAQWLRWAAVLATVVPFALSLLLMADFQPSADGDAYTEQATWMKAQANSDLVNNPASGYTANTFIHFDYHVGLDGITMPLVLLTTLVSLMAALASFQIKKRWKAFYSWFLLLEASMLGVFLARDLIVFFIFFELTIIAAYFLIGIWGYGNKERAANRFLLYNGTGSAIMLLAFIILIATAGFRIEVNEAAQSVSYFFSGDYATLVHNLSDPSALANVPPAQLGQLNPFYISEQMETMLFLMLLIAFAIKLPIVPFHTWMLKVHTEAAPAVVMIHSGILLKMGAYGLLRFGVFLFPDVAHEWALALGILGAINVLYGALLALVQREFKLVLAYSSISHMGIVLLGIASFNELGLQGAVFQLVSHGLISALLFLIVGSLYERAHTTRLDELGGLARPAPFMSAALLVAGMASLGMPGLSGFVGEFMAFAGLFETQEWVAGSAAIGLVLAAAYMLRAVLKITFGPAPEQLAAIRDARFSEAVPMITLLAFIVLFGLYPSLLTDTMKHSFDVLLSRIYSGLGG